MDSHITWPYQIPDHHCRVMWVYNKYYGVGPFIGCPPIMIRTWQAPGSQVKVKVYGSVTDYIGHTPKRLKICAEILHLFPTSIPPNKSPNLKLV